MGIQRTIANLLSGRKKVEEENLSFDSAMNHLRTIRPGVDVNLKFVGGCSSIRHIREGSFNPRGLISGLEINLNGSTSAHVEIFKSKKDSSQRVYMDFKYGGGKFAITYYLPKSQ